jgi:hypothetical protein
MNNKKRCTTYLEFSFPALGIWVEKREKFSVSSDEGEIK